MDGQTDLLYQYRASVCWRANKIIPSDFTERCPKSEDFTKQHVNGEVTVVMVTSHQQHQSRRSDVMVVCIQMLHLGYVFDPVVATFRGADFIDSTDMLAKAPAPTSARSDCFLIAFCRRSSRYWAVQQTRQRRFQSTTEQYVLTSRNCTLAYDKPCRLCGLSARSPHASVSTNLLLVIDSDILNF